MFCMFIDRGCVATQGNKLYSLCVLRDVAFLQERFCNVL